jgi:predicted membrane channel-forming protein YqfA (hemolysin III family)
MKPVLRPSWRKGAGILIILSLILIWAALVASLAPVVGKWPGFVQAAFYLFMGIVWILPLKPLIRWTETGRWRAPSDPDG